MPTFVLRDKSSKTANSQGHPSDTIQFAAFKKHISLFASSVIALEKELSAYQTSGKGTIQFPNAEPLPKKVIEKIIRRSKTAQNVKRNPIPILQNSKDKESKLTRKLNPMPKDVKEALEKNGLLKRYQLRPPYQRNDYLSWINKAIRPETRLKRINQTLKELKEGRQYMGMKYNAKI
jgi:uncharacterized protein YdeI (YjbR/CyaY-like superfamily)